MEAQFVTLSFTTPAWSFLSITRNIESTSFNVHFGIRYVKSQQCTLFKKGPVQPMHASKGHPFSTCLTSQDMISDEGWAFHRKGKETTFSAVYSTRRMLFESLTQVAGTGNLLRSWQQWMNGSLCIVYRGQHAEWSITVFRKSVHSSAFTAAVETPLSYFCLLKTDRVWRNRKWRIFNDIILQSNNWVEWNYTQCVPCDLFSPPGNHGICFFSRFHATTRLCRFYCVRLIAAA